MPPRRWARKLKKKKSASAKACFPFPSGTSFSRDAPKRKSALDHPGRRGRNQRLSDVLDGPNGQDVPQKKKKKKLCWSRASTGLMYSFSISSSSDPGSSCQSKHKSQTQPFPLGFLRICGGQIHNASLETDANALNTCLQSIRHKQNQGEFNCGAITLVHICTHTHTYTHHPATLL